MKLRARRFVLAGVLVAAASNATACRDTGSDAKGNPAIATPPSCSVAAAVACSGGSTGFACASGANPENADDTLVCSTPVSVGGDDDYCCLSGPAGSQSTCQSDDTLECATGTFGYSCASGDDPADFDATLSCSAGSGGVDGGAAVFCCAPGGTFPGDDASDDDGGSGAGCSADDTITCTGDAAGYSCSGDATPEAVDPNLACSPPTIDARGIHIYCCVDE